MRLQTRLHQMGGPLPDNPRRWRWAVASRVGTSHQRTGTRKQDAYAVSVVSPDTIFLVVSDGAGSASHGGQGASLVCRCLVSSVRAWFSRQATIPSDDHVEGWIDDLRDNLAAIAHRRGLTRRDFAATLVMLVVTGTEILTVQIGDSALVARKDGVWEALCWPESGEFASTTYFVTDDPEVRLRVVRRPLEFDAFALFTDGLESLALEHATLKPYARFFDPMIKPVDLAEGNGRLRNLSAALGRYLDGQAICDRTDDDKTLILLSGA